MSVWHVKGAKFCSVIGISNRFLHVMMPESGVLTAEDVYPDTKENRVIVRVTPGVVHQSGAVGDDCKLEEPDFIENWPSLKMSIQWRED